MVMPSMVFCAPYNDIGFLVQIDILTKGNQLGPSLIRVGFLTLSVMSEKELRKVGPQKNSWCFVAPLEVTKMGPFGSYYSIGGDTAATIKESDHAIRLLYAGSRELPKVTDISCPAR
jgi:hypothetical protein